MSAKTMWWAVKRVAEAWEQYQCRPSCLRGAHQPSTLFFTKGNFPNYKRTVEEKTWVFFPSCFSGKIAREKKESETPQEGQQRG